MTMRLSLSVVAALAGTAVLAGCETMSTPTSMMKSAAPWPNPGNSLVMAKEKAANNALTVVRRASLATSPLDAAWASIPAADVELVPQQVTAPGLETASLSSLQVQGMTDGKSISWRLIWADDTADGNVDAARFSDAVAIEFPLQKDANAMMGGTEGTQVQILFWKALWQKDVDVGFQDVESLHPNVWSDLYWFAQGERPYNAATSFKDPKARQWLVALSAGNPVAAVERAQPVEEIVAKGWGSATHQKESVTTGAGAWSGGHWSVVFTRPLASQDPLDYQFKSEGTVAFAVWQGSAGNTGARKHWADWVDFKVQP